MRILIIEDDKNLCQIMRAGLQDAGIDSDFCHDGETGLELLLHKPMTKRCHGLFLLYSAKMAKSTSYF